jgi:ribosomal protein S18 acetylase RimI-like enzyme
VPQTESVRWLGADDRDLAAGVRRIVLDVVGKGGAIGWPDGATAGEVDAWFADRLADAAAGRCRFALARDDSGVLQALGRWVRNPNAVWRHNATISQVMTHSDARGRGLARAVMEALIADARAAGIESLVLNVRGNNHGAERLYRSLGFREVGVLRDYVAVGAHRFDLVDYQLILGQPADIVRHGRTAGGPGST